jgi:hypothetical protein
MLPIGGPKRNWQNYQWWLVLGFQPSVAQNSSKVLHPGPHKRI